MLGLWRKLAGKGWLLAGLDFVLLAMAVYSGYAIRLGMIVPRYVPDCLAVMCVLPCVCVAVFLLAGQYRTIWQHAGTEDFSKFLWLYIVAVGVFMLINAAFRLAVFPRTSAAIAVFAGLFLCGGLRAGIRGEGLGIRGEGLGIRGKGLGIRKVKALIFGAGEAGVYLARDLLRNNDELSPVGFADDDASKIGRNVSGLRVMGSSQDLREIVRTQNIQVVLIAIPSANGSKIRQIYDTLAPLNVQVRILPSLRELAGGTVSVSRLRKVRLEDLLGREPIRINLEQDMNYIQGKRVLITGAGGSIGSEIVRQVLHNNPSEILALGHGEQSIYLLMEGLDTHIPVKPVIADVADETAIRALFSQYSPQVIFHAAAHKHVPLMETAPREAMRVNALGTRTVARMAGEFGASRMVMISTDKAVNPSSIMGATKRLAEKVLEREQHIFPETKFMAVRFGNVLGSRGSVIPKFEAQIAAGGPVTVTHPDMKRYFMLIPEAVSLVIQAGALGHGGELFVLDMGEPVVIREMAELLIRLCGYEPYKDIDIVYSGIRPGEKLYEELFYDENAVRGTVHPKIYVSNIANNMPHPQLDALLERALSRPDEAVSVLRELVPEYEPVSQ